jgi:alpha-L-fucosidase
MTGGYPAHYLPPLSFVYNGVNFTFLTYKLSRSDNIHVSGEVIHVPLGKYFSAYLVTAAESGSLTEGHLNVTYKDDTVVSSPLLVPVWWYNYLFGGDIIFPYYYTNKRVDFNKSMIYLINSKLGYLELGFEVMRKRRKTTL